MCHVRLVVAKKSIAASIWGSSPKFAEIKVTYKAYLTIHNLGSNDKVVNLRATKIVRLCGE
jgi:hypothetical protein